MPLLHIITNVEKSKFDEAFLKELTTTMSTLSGKPEKFIMITVNAGELMSMNGTTEPTANVTFKSVGKVDDESNSKYATALTKAMTEKGIPADRTYVGFIDVKRDMYARNGKLFSK